MRHDNFSDREWLVKKTAGVLAVSVATMALAGCATGPKPGQGMSADVIRDVREQGLRPAFGFDGAMVKATKTKAVLGTMAGFFAGGQNLQITHKSANGYVQTEGRDSGIDATQIAALKGPSEATALAVNRRLEHAGVPTTSVGKYSLMASSKAWGLTYDSLGGSDNYRLYYDLTLELREGKDVLRSYNCTGATEAVTSMKAWLADDEAMVHRNAAAIGDICAEQALVAMDIVGAKAG
jgi:hypothetical protein